MKEKTKEKLEELEAIATKAESEDPFHPVSVYSVCYIGSLKQCVEELKNFEDADDMKRRLKMVSVFPFKLFESVRRINKEGYEQALQSHEDFMRVLNEMKDLYDDGESK